MPKPTGKRKYSGSGYGEKDFQRELVQADKRQLQEERARKKDTAGKTQRMNELNKQYREINSYVGPELPGDRAARERGYYANLAQYGADYGDRAAYDSGYQRYKAAMQSIETAGAQTARTAAGTARMARAGDMIQDVLRRGTRPFEMLGGKRAADFAAEDLAVQGSRLDRDRRTYTQMARGAQMAGDPELLRSARQGLTDSAGRYADAMAAYGEKSRGARDSYLRELEQTNKGAYYGETHGAQEIEGRLRDLRRKRETLDSMDVTWTDGMGGPAETKQDYVSARGQELDAEIAQWEAALRHRNAIDKADEMRRVAESITNAPNFRELSEVGRAMVENRNKQARDSAIYPEEPEDPDNWRNYQRYLQEEKEALAKAGYVADLDSSYIPEDVKPVYYALFAQSPAKAKEWAEYWKGIGEDEHWRQIYEASGEDAGSRLGAFIQGTFANTVAGLNPFGEGGQYAAKLGSTMIGGGAAGLTEKGLFNTGALAGEIDVPIFGKQTLGNAYQLGSSMLQSAANATLAKMTGGAAEIVGGMGTILLGSSAAAQDYQQKLEQGWDESSAKWHALAAGAAEAGFEYLSLDKLVNQNVSRGFIRNVLLQGGIEASEEVNTTIANRLTDAAISALSGYDNSIQQRAKELMAFGYEAGTADKMAQQEWLTELLNDALGGFLSGGMMTGGQYAMLPVYKAVGAVDDFQRFTGTLSSTGETAIASTEELTRGKAGALAGQIGASLNAETVEAARRIMGEDAQNNVDGGQIARATEQNDGGDVAVNDRRYDVQNDNMERGTGNPSPTEQKQSRREQRRQAREQQKQSTRDGAVYEQAVQKIRQAIDQRGVGAVNEVYAETVEQYGEAAKGIAQEAITRAVSSQLSEARNVADIDRMTQAENAAPEVRAAIQQAKDLRSYQLFAQNGDTEAAERAIQSRRNSGRGSGALRLEAEYSGEDGSVKRAEITGVTANAESVKLSNGETVSVKQLANLDADTRDVLDRIAYMEVGPAADILWKSYLAEAGSGTDGYRYVMDWATAYDQGRQGSVSLKEAQGRSSLSAETVKNAYELGEQYGKDLDAKQKAELAEKMKITQKGATGRAGTVNTEQIGGMRLSEDQNKQLEIVKRLAEAFGIDVEVFASDTRDVTANGETRRQFVGENGRYQDGKIWLDINAGLNYTDDVGSGLVATMGHELTHFIQQYAPDEYRAYKRFVLATIRQQEGSQGLERLIREKIQRSKGQNLSRSAAEDEVVADAAQTVLTDSQALRQMAEQEPTLFRKVLDWIKDFFDSIREALSSSPRMSEEARLFWALEADVRKTFGELWDKGITEAVRVHDQVGDIESGQKQNSDRDAEYLDAVNSGDMEMAQRMVDEAAREAGYTVKAYHGTTEDFTEFSRGKQGQNHNGYLEFGAGFYFTPSEKEARSWAERGKNGPARAKDSKVMAVYLNPGRVVEADAPIPGGTEYLQSLGLTKADAAFVANRTYRFINYLLEDKGYSNVEVQEQLKSMGFDAVKDTYRNDTEGQYVVFDPEQIKSADPVTYDDKKKPIPLSKRFDDTKRDIRFSMRDPVETTDRLIAWHNMNEDALRSALELGGLAMPSWAIKTADRAHTSYGNISVIAPRELVDPKMNRSSMIFGGDAWTPVFHGVDYDISYEATEKLYDEIAGLIGEDVMRELGGAAIDTENIANQLGNNSGEVSSYYKNNTALRYAYLKSIGKDIAIPQRETRLDDFGKYSNKYFEANGVIPGEADKYALAKEIDKVIDEEAYEKWIGNKLNQTIRKKGIRNDKDTFTPSGNRRSFDALHYAYNLANIVKAMKSQPKQGRTQFLSGPGSVKGAALKNYNTVEQVRKDRGRLVDSAEEGQAAYDEYNRNLEDILDRMSKNGDRFDAADALIEVFQHAKTESGIYSYMQRELKDWYNISHELAHDAYELIGQINKLPMEYFEGKTYDAVRFDETAAVVVPDNIDQALKQQLEDAGARVVEYKAGDDADRLAKVNSVEEAKFSERDYDLPSDLDLMDRAAESLSEAGGEEYWKALLEAAPELAEDNAELKSMAKAYREQSRKLDEAEKKLAEARQQLVTTDRKLRTRGISGVTTSILKDLHAGDVKNRNVQQTVTDILTKAYQKGLDAIDAGKSQSEVWDVVYNEGIVKAADYILENATYSEKTSRKWTTVILNKYMTGEEGRYAVLDAISARVVPDWWESRARQPLQQTAADRIVSRVEGRMQKQIDAQTQRAESAEASNRKLREDLDFYKEAQDNAAKQVTFLGKRLEEARADMKDVKQADAKERRQKTARIRSLENQLKAKRDEAGAWKQMASRNESLLRAALKSKNADLEAQVQRADKAEAALAGQTVNAKAWERNADLYAKQLDKQLEQKAKIVKQLEAQVQREKDILSGKLKPLAMQRLLAAAREEAASKAKKQKEEVFQSYKERKHQSDLRRRIKNLSDEMKRRMTNPSERAYVPAALYESMTRLTDVLDELLSPKPGTRAAARYQATLEAIRGLAKEYRAVQDLDDPTYASEYDKEIQDAIDAIERTLERKDADWVAEMTGDTKKGLRELGTGELQHIYELLRSINYNMVSASQMLGFKAYGNLFDTMRAVAEQQRSLPRLIDENGIRRWNRSRLLDNLSVMRGVEMMSGWDRDAALYQLMHNIEQGTDASWAWVMDYNKSQQALKTGKNEKEYREALTKKLDYGVTDEEGRKVLMTKLQALQILMTAEREAHNDKLLHLQAGGAKIRDAIDLQNGKGAQARSQTIQVTPELIQRIQESVTDWDRAYMKNVRDYFRKEGKRTNEILYKLKHRVLQTEDYYVPYKVDDNYLETKLTEQQAMNMWVKTPGSTNALKQKAKQPVIIDGMDTVMGQHVKEMGDYIGLAIPIRDFSKVYNGRLPTGNDNPLPVKKTIDDTFGKKGQHLLTQAVIDVQGGSGGQSWRSGISDFLNKLQGGFVRSALLINPSVTIKQAASYIAAESVLSHWALVQGNRATIASTDKTKSPALIAYLFANPEGKTAQRIYSEIDQYTSLHYQRRQGMSQAEIANEANRNGRVKRWMNGIGASMEQNRIGHAVRKAGENLNPVTWIQRMDVATTAALWVACKQQAKMDGLKTGTEEFWQHTTELYERVIRETQPMYDSLHRTAHQKQSGTLTQFLFPFRTVPIQNHGQLAASYEALKASRNKSKAEQKQAGKFFAKTVWAQTESAAIFALMTFIAAALKRKTKKYRDEDEELNAKSVGMGLGKDVASTLFSVLQPMYGSELVSIGSRAMDKFSGSSGYTYDAFSVGVVDMINDLISASDKLLEDAGKANRGESVSFADVSSHGLSLLLKGAKLAGIPADTVRTYWEGLVGNAKDAMDGRIPALNDESWERSADVNAERYLKAWIAGDLEKVDRVEAEMLGNYTEAGKSEKKASEAMKTKMTATAKAAWESGRLDKQDAIDFLTETGYYDKDEAWKTVQRWEGNAAHKGDDDYNYSQYEDLNNDLNSGKSFAEAAAEYLEHGYKEEDLRENAVKNAKKRYQAGDLTEDEAIDLLLDYAWKKENGQYRNLTQDEAWMKVKEWRESADYTEEDGSWGQYDAIDEALAGNKEVKGLISELTAHGVKEDSINQHIKGQLVQNYVDGKTNESQLKNQLSRYLGIVAKADVDKILKDANSKKLYGVAYSSLDEEYRAGKIGKAEIKQALMKQGGLSSGEAEQKIRWYDLQKANPKLEISEAVCNAWYDGTTNGSQKYGHESAKNAGMSIERYVEARKYLDTVKDSNGNGTGEDEVIQALAGMSGLTAREKDALYYERYKGGTRKGIYKTW